MLECIIDFTVNPCQVLSYITLKKIIKICFVSPKAYPIFNPACNSVFGGAEVDIYHIATELAKDPAYEISCIVADYDQPAIETRENVKLIKSLTFRENQLAGAIKVWQAMKLADADRYFIKTASFGTFLTALFCKLKKRQFVYRSAHTDECDGTWVRKNRFAGQLFKWSLNNATLVFVQNQSDKLNLQKTFKLDPVVIPNAHRIKNIGNKDRKHLLWTGRSVASKQPEIFIELAKNNPQYQFVMICQKATNDNNYQRLTEQSANIPNLTFIERVPFSQVHTFFEQALTFVNTSTAEGFPNTFIQACIAGTPILSLTVNPDGFLEIFDCGLCANGDQNKLNPCLQQLLENFDHYHTTTRNYALENHNIEKVVQSYKLHLGN